MPVLPFDRYHKYINEYGLVDKDASTIVRDKKLSDYYEECIKLNNNPSIISNWLTGDVLKNLNKNSISIEDSNFKPAMLIELINLIETGKINGKQGKIVLEKSIETGKEPKILVSELGLTQISDEEEIRKIILEVMNENEKLLNDYKEGKKVFDYFIGQIMKKTQGRANPVITSKILQKELNKII